MTLPQIVIDTNILVAGLRSKRGFAFQLLERVGKGYFEINLSVPLILEYEAILYRELPGIGVSHQIIDAVIDYHCLVATHHEIFFLWRPFLRDPKDDMVLELSVKAQSQFIVTFNKRDFKGIEQFGITALTPQEFFTTIGVVL